MKRTIFALLLLTATTLSIAQAQSQKLARDSMKYYQAELNKLWRNTYDSLKNSDRYKELSSKIGTGHQKKVTVELLGYFGIYWTDFKNLNARLRSIGQQEIKPSVPSLGGSLAIGLPIMTYGLEFSGYISQNNTAIFKGVHERLYIGTNLFKKGKIALHPQVGFAGSLIHLFIPNSQGQFNFNDLFMTQANSVQLTHSNNYLDFALGLKLKSHTKDPFYWQFLRLGYRYGLKENPWTVKNGTIQNAPVDRNNQYYLQLCIGFDK